MNMRTALDQMRVRKDLISTHEKSFLDENGYLVFPEILTQIQVQSFNEQLAKLAEEEENSGHSRTYNGAMPGKIIQSMRKAGSTNHEL